MKILLRLNLLLLAFSLLTTCANAQKRRPATQKAASAPPVQQPAPTFDHVLATDSYRVYVEIRNLGQLLKTPSFSDLTEPIVKVTSPPKEFQTLMKWLNSQSDSLITSRIMVASWASRPKLPNVLLAIEFPSPEEAQKFEPRLKTLLPKLFPAPKPETASGPQANASKEKSPTDTPQSTEKEAQPKEVKPSFVVKQAGSLIFISDTTFTFKNLRPVGSKLLTEDPNFRRVYDRFSTESVFVYVDTAAMEREDQERREKFEEEMRKSRETAQANVASGETEEVSTEIPPEMQTEPLPPPVVSDPDAVPEAPAEIGASDHFEISPQPKPENTGGELLGRMSQLLFGGRTNWPDAIGVALAFEPDNYALRVLLVSEPNAKANPIPFMPQLVSGPPLTPEAPAVFPAQTELFVSVSLDYPQIYDSVGKVVTERSSPTIVTTAGVEEPEESPFATYERKSGIKLKNDLIPLLGNEVALMLPLQAIGISAPPSEPVPPEPDGTSDTAKPSATAGPNPVIAIAIRDREGVRALIPKVIDSFGVKGASLLAQTEKRGDTEIVSYGDALSYAFVGNFLLLSPSSREIRQVVDAYLNHDTLAGDSHFRNSTRWQPRQVLGQFYLSPKFMEGYRDGARGLEPSITDQLSEFLSRLTPTVEPLTYALSNEGSGPLHEVRVPKNMALLALASMFGVPKEVASAAANEANVQWMMRTISSAETSFRASDKDGSYGSKDQLIAAGMISKDFFEKNGYRIELNASGSRFEATALPLEYGKTGKLSFFVDESNVLRAGDHGGGPATIADKPVQ